MSIVSRPDRHHHRLDNDDVDGLLQIVDERRQAELRRIRSIRRPRSDNGFSEKLVLCGTGSSFTFTA
jgi:hypothetical protein